MADNPRFEYAVATVPSVDIDCEEEEADDGMDSLFRMAAEMARRVNLAIVEASRDDGVSCLMMLKRAAGMTLEEIASGAGCSKQAVRKRFMNIIRRFPAMEGYLHLSDPGILDSAISPWEDILAMSSRHHATLRKMTSWMFDAKS